ncbi:MAG: DUF5069 domain-containing protein [Candidatus Latescibacterota bacterium]|nr:DUF5069 domain-containing protein [Candidatus Latescibacterota bacterium]
MDLFRQPPRRPSNLNLSGVVGLSRMADKVRAKAHNTIGEYSYGHESPLDIYILNFIGLSPEEFSKLALNMNDEKLFGYIRSNYLCNKSELADFNSCHLQNGSQDIYEKGIRSQTMGKCEQDRTDIKTIFESIEFDDRESFRGLDLTVEPPRTPYERSILGIVGIARMADKARAYNSNRLGEYRYGPDSGLDTAILEFLELNAGDFMRAAIDNPNDIELSEWLAGCVKKDDSAKFSFNARRAYFGFYGKEREIFLARRIEVGCDGSVADTFFDLMDFDDQKSFLIVDLRRRAPRSVYDVSIGGIAGLARLIDKGFAHKYKMLGIYKFGERSFLDKLVLDFLKLSETEFIDALQRYPTEIEIINWLREIDLNTNEDEIESFNEVFWNSGPFNQDQREIVRKTSEALDPQRKNICCFAASAELEDEIHFARMKVRI